MACGCEPKKYSVSMGCCQPVLGPIENYYTKYQIDEMLEEIESAITSGCCITPEEVDEKIESAKTDIEAEIPSLSGYATEQWVLDKNYITGVDLSNYALKSEIPTVPTSNTAFTNDAGYLTEHQSLSGYATEQWVINQNYIDNSEFIQYITNLQNQIDSLKAQISGCCGETGETLYRWVTMIGENDYWCDGTTKKALEKKQSSSDGINWVDVVPNEIRSGSTVLQYECPDCGYNIGGMRITLNDNTTIDIDCQDVPNRPCGGGVKYYITHDFITSAVTSVTSITEVKRIDIGTCVNQITSDAFSGFTNLQKVVLPSTFKSIHNVPCNGVDVNSFENTAIRTVGMEGSNADIIWNNNMDDMASEMFKGCTALTSVELHDGFGTFEPYVFSGCTNLQSITLHSTTLPILNSYAKSGYQYDALDGIGNNTFVIYVPSNMVDTYKNAVDSTGFRNWSKYASHIQAIP